jgi:hypothetical protein
LRADVTDPIHYQPYSGHYTYNADCLQLAIDPMLRRDDCIGCCYTFNLALTPEVPELFRTFTPDREASPDFKPPEKNVSLGSRHLKVEKKENGLIYQLELPWKEIQPVKPCEGARIGVYFIMFNNNGKGLIDTMHWPVPIEGMWMIPNRWGILSLV